MLTTLILLSLTFAFVDVTKILLMAEHDGHNKNKIKCREEMRGNNN